jgi:GT2 family glycosyltransferase
MQKRPPPRYSKSASNISVAVCVCTYKRPRGLERLLEALTKQSFTDLPRPYIGVIVVDNEDSQTVRDICDHYRATELGSLDYVLETTPGISYARNAGLERIPVGTDFIAMIDDDEIPVYSWLNHLLLAQQATEADIVVGPTSPVFQGGTAAWIPNTGYFDKPHRPGSLIDMQDDPPAATCNALVRASVFTRHHYRFDPALSLSGGEDKLLFQELKQHGYRVAWAANAQVHEYVPSDRATLAYMLQEEYRRGTVKYYVKSRLKARSPAKPYILAPKTACRAIAKTIRSTANLFIQTIITRGNKAAMALAAIDIADSIGILAGLFGFKKQHYRK